MTRFVPVTVLVMLLMAGGAVHAQGTGSGSLPNGATITFQRRQIYDESKKDGSFFEPQAGSPELLQYFNLAHCTCAQANLGQKDGVGTFKYLVRETPASGLHVHVDFFAGTNCDDLAHRTGTTATCTPQIASVNDIDADLNIRGDNYLSFNLYQAVNANQTGNCLQFDGANNSIFALVDTAGGTSYNYSASQPVGTLAGEMSTSGVDTKPPPAPEQLSATPSENAIQLSWKAPSSRATDVYAYQALCAKVDGSAAKPSPPKALYRTTLDVCDIENDQTLLVQSDGGQPGTIPLPMELVDLQPDRICGEARASTATSLTIDHLENGTPYYVMLLAIDLHGNYAGTYLADTVTPHLVTDFWEDLHARDSKAEGGLCLLAETYGDDSSLTRILRAFRDDTLGGSRVGRWLSHAYYTTLGKLGVYVHGSIALRGVAAVLLAPLVAFALLWHWISLPGLLGLIAAAWWYRRWRRTSLRRGLRWSWLRLPAFAGAAVILLGAGPAHAGGYQPYWEDSDPTDQSKNEQAAPGDPSLVKWHAGIRVGPYIPDIDNQLGMHPGPYEQMFGGYRILPMLDVDRMLWSGFGQVGVGVSVGYMQKTAHAFAMSSDPTQTDRPREPGAKNTFRLIPFELTGTYRFTILDDDYGIPVVPYARGGLAYYVWWVDAPNGGFARVCSDGKDTSMEPGCSTNKALGASLGVQGSIGLAIRAERIDASTAMSMRQSGIQHAGIYGELSLAKVDGFGSDKKLSVGDRTWFAGVDFEF